MHRIWAYIIFIYIHVKSDIMNKKTLQFHSLTDMALFTRAIRTGYLMNTGKLTLSGHFTEKDINLAINQFDAEEIETTEKVFTY